MLLSQMKTLAASGSVLMFSAMLSCAPQPPPPPAECGTPLDLYEPIHSGTRTVGYEKGLQGCPVTVRAGQSEVGEGRVPPFGWGQVALNRALVSPEVVTATQAQSPPTSPHFAVTVEQIPATALRRGETFFPPTIKDSVMACQLGFRVEGKVPGSRVGYGITGSMNAVGAVWTPYPDAFVAVEEELEYRDEITLWQDMESSFPIRSEDSPAYEVLPKPTEIWDPVILNDVGKDLIQDVVEGSTAVRICLLYVGARIHLSTVDEVTGGTVWADSSRVAHAECVDQGALPAIQKGQKFCVAQSLCDLRSKTNCVAVASQGMSVPRIVEPICEGDTEVIVKGTVLNSRVTIAVNGSDAVTVSAPGPATAVPIGNGLSLSSGDQVKARQANEILQGNWTSDVTVASAADCEAMQKPAYSPPGPGTGSSSTPNCEGDTSIGQTCTVQPPQCSGRGTEWTVEAKIECVSGQAQCRASPATNTDTGDYCKQAGAVGCGGATGHACSPSNLCAPAGLTCLNFRCEQMGGGCKTPPNFCWLPSEVGQEELGCE